MKECKLTLLLLARIWELLLLSVLGIWNVNNLLEKQLAMYIENFKYMFHSTHFWEYSLWKCKH